MSESTSLRLSRARVPSNLLEYEGARAAVDDTGLTTVDITVADGVIAGIVPTGTGPEPGSLPVLDLDFGMVLPGLIDSHTHLDKGHIWPRQQNPDGTWQGALVSTADDRAAHWSGADVAARMDFGLRCAYAHGTVAIRSHLDCVGKQTAISWVAAADCRDRWADRIDVQLTSLAPPDTFLTEEGDEIARTVARYGGVLGCVTRLQPDLDIALDRVFRHALDLDLDLDFHVDETGDPEARSLQAVAEAALRHGFERSILTGHACALARQDSDVVDRTLDLVAEAGVAVVSLPMCNMYLQDRVPGRTPRWRGVTLLQEMQARGIAVMVASDNCRDPFYAYGDHDMVEVFREAVRTLHLDHPIAGWPSVISLTPAAVMGCGDRFGTLAPGRSADLIAFRARSYSELLSRPQSDRRVMRAGRVITRALPDYRDLDSVVGF